MHEDDGRDNGDKWGNYVDAGILNGSYTDENNFQI